MSVHAYDRNVSPVEMQDGRRRAWKIRDDLYEVISRDGTERYRVEVIGGLPLCNCEAAHFRQPCWHASLVLDRVERESAKSVSVPERPGPTVAELFGRL